MNAVAPTRVVFDCMVFLQGAARKTSPEKACLDLAENGFVELCLSAEIVAEVKDVLTRPEIQRKFLVLVSRDVNEFMERLSAKAAHFQNVPVEFPSLPISNRNLVLNSPKKKREEPEIEFFNSLSRLDSRVLQPISAVRPHL